MRTALVLSVILVLLLAGCPQKPTDAPEAALNAYEALKLQYADSGGAALERCTKDGSVIYRAGGSEGSSGVYYYYDANGTALGNYPWHDAAKPGEPPVDLTGYGCTLLKISGAGAGDAWNATSPDQKPFLDAGCIVESGYLNCANASFASRYNCSGYGTRMVEGGAYLDPPLAMIDCLISPGESGGEGYFFCSGGLRYLCVTYIAAHGDEFVQVKDSAALAALAAPITTPREALAFVFLSKPVNSGISTWSDSTALPSFKAGAMRMGDRFLVTAYAPDATFGCYDRRNHEEITYEVTTGGMMTEIGRWVVYTEYLPNTMCVD